MKEPTALQPDEERFRLLDAVSQFLIAVSQRAPIVLALDDLHWADKGTIAMLRHVARFAKQNRILLVGAYRDVELDSEHPLSEALGQLRHETEYERLLLKGLDRGEVGELLTAITEREAPVGLVEAISRETDGNPFFIRETLLHLAETGALYRERDRWTGGVTSVEELGIPEGVRQVVTQRLSRLSESTNRLLTAASAFNGVFRLDIAARVADIEEQAALEAIDEALAAQVLRPGGERDTLDFTHALLRHTLYAELSPPRQARLHRQIVEAMESTYRERAIEHAAEIAYHYHCSATLAGAERGVEYAFAAADKAEAAYANDETAAFLRIALELLPAGDARQPRLLGRLALALAWALDGEGSLQAASTATRLIAAREGSDEAANYAAQVVTAMTQAGIRQEASELADEGMKYVGERRDAGWAILRGRQIERNEVNDPGYEGILGDTRERREFEAEAAGFLPEDGRNYRRIVSTRDEALALANWQKPGYLTFFAGEYRAAMVLWQKQAEVGEKEGRIPESVFGWAGVARCRNALGDLPAAGAAYERGMSMAARVSGDAAHNIHYAHYELCIAADDGWRRFAGPSTTTIMEQRSAPELKWATAMIEAAVAMVHARLGRRETAGEWLAKLIRPIELGVPWATNFTAVACDAAEAAWLIDSGQFAQTIERNILQKVVQPDFRFPMRDGRLALARLCALQGRHNEAVDWFQQSREVLDEQGARPLQAIVDYDEALMYVRRGRKGDRGRAAPLVEAALSQFREIGMTGWIRRAEELQRGIEEKSMGAAIHPGGLTPREVDVLRLIARGRTNAEIAADLTLSIRTVARHITHIYEKTGARNKSEATDYAHRKGLAGH